jgi:hypothetical protein
VKRAESIDSQSRNKRTVSVSLHAQAILLIQVKSEAGTEEGVGVRCSNSAPHGEDRRREGPLTTGGRARFWTGISLYLKGRRDLTWVLMGKLQDGKGNLRDQMSEVLR